MPGVHFPLGIGVCPGAPGKGTAYVTDGLGIPFAVGQKLVYLLAAGSPLGKDNLRPDAGGCVLRGRLGLNDQFFHIVGDSSFLDGNMPILNGQERIRCAKGPAIQRKPAGAGVDQDAPIEIRPALDVIVTVQLHPRRKCVTHLSKRHLLPQATEIRLYDLVADRPVGVEPRQYRGAEALAQGIAQKEL